MRGWGGIGGHAWLVGGMHDRGACVAGGGHVWLGGGACVAGDMRSKRDGHCSGRYASYWNALLLLQRQQQRQR